MVCSLVCWVCWCAVRHNDDLPGLLPPHRVVSGAHTGTLKVRDSDVDNTTFLYCHCVWKGDIILENFSQAPEGPPHYCSALQGIWLPGPTWSCTSSHQTCPTFRSNWRLVCCSEDDWRTMGCVLGYRPKFKVATYLPLRACSSGGGMEGGCG